MKKIILVFSAFLFFAACNSGDKNNASANFELTSETDSIYYALGANFTQSLMRGRIAVDAKELEKGYRDCQAGQSYINKKNYVDAVGSLRIKYRNNQLSDSKNIVMDSLSYAFGGNQYYLLQSLGLDVNHEALIHGMLENTQEGGGKLNPTEIRIMLDKFRTLSETAQSKMNVELAKENEKLGVEYMAKIALEPGVQATSSGLRYKVIKEGTGAMPKPTDEVSVHYEGRLIDGTIFDSSIQRGKPSDFFLNRVIKGWTEGIQMMKEGAKYRLYIPSNLAYGDKGFGQLIPPGSTLTFDVELLEIKK